MKTQTTCRIPVLITGVSKRDWKIVDKETGNERSGVVNTLQGVMIPENPATDPAYLKRVEFNIYDNNPQIIGTAEVCKTFYSNEEKFKKGEVYAQVETYMAPNVGKDGKVSFFKPYVNNIQVVSTSDEERPSVLAAARHFSQL